MSTERSFQAELDLARPFTEDDPCLPVCPWNAGLAIVPGGTPDSDVNISSRISWPANIGAHTAEKWRHGLQQLQGRGWWNPTLSTSDPSHIFADGRPCAMKKAELN